MPPEAEPRRPRRLLTALLLVVLIGALLATGAGVAAVLDDALGIANTPADIPAEDPTAAPERVASPLPTLDVVTYPADDVPIAAAAEDLSDAIAERGGAPPRLETYDPERGGAARPAADGEATLLVTVGTIPADPSPEAYRLTTTSGDHSLETATTAGAVVAVQTYADRIRSARPAFPTSEDGTVTAPRMGTRLIDAGAVGFDDDPARFAEGDDYSLNTDVVASAVLPDAPYVDAAAVDDIAQQFHDLVDHALSRGYNGVVVPGFLEYVTFRDVGDGHAVYPEGDPHVARAEAMVDAFAPVWQYAADQGLQVYFLTDMLAVSPPLRDYLDAQGHAIDDPAFWTVYQAGMRELLEAMPFASGTMIRVGEGGSAYALDGWDYSSELAVTTAPAVRTMLRALLEVADETDVDVIFRTWTVGVGPVGDLHTNPASYDAVLGDLDDPHLVVSTKLVAGDFYSHLPLNPTLERGTQRRIVELQARREFEGLGALPDDLGDLTQTALDHFLDANPNVEGVWTWAQGGGPLYAGPRSLYLRDGFWQLADLNVYVAGRLAADPGTDPGEATADWVRQTFSADPQTVRTLGEAFALSREAITDGLYIGPYADQSVKALGLEPPPMMWIFEWDLVTGDSASLGAIYHVSRDAIDEAIAEGEQAAQAASRMRLLVEDTDPATWRDPALRQELVDNLAYEENLVATLTAYRATVLRHRQWLDTGSSEARTAWEDARATYETERAAHVARYGDDLDQPAYNFTAAEIGTVRADRDPAMAWAARVLLALVVVVGALALALRRRRAPGIAAVRALGIGAVAPWRLRGPAPTRIDAIAVWALPAALLVASRATLTWFAAPAHLLVTLGSWLLFVGVARLLVGRRDPYALWAALGGVAVLRTVVLLLALILRGPGRYWLEFWTDPEARSLYVTIAFAAFCWLFVAATVVLRNAYGLGWAGGSGRVLLAAAAPLLVLGALVGAVGLEDALTVWNDQMALLPWGLSRILGITVHLGIPTWLPWAACGLGAALALLGAGVLALTRSRGAPPANA
ncbi:glycosyl hydrolase family 67 [Mumia flava]|uniref:Glycosyl hydrolase family 67 n=1 Tax=Mumia flava TaxID=1348852 RepID=A0A2M9BH60_9ACTN|nr:hypothetical protein [Mumia flava]PJJ57287.1 glycosyl hydrolase family 67 [Mumia flava]